MLSNNSITQVSEVDTNDSYMRVRPRPAPRPASEQPSRALEPFFPLTEGPRGFPRGPNVTPFSRAVNTCQVLVLSHNNLTKLPDSLPRLQVRTHPPPAGAPGPGGAPLPAGVRRDGCPRGNFRVQHLQKLYADHCELDAVPAGLVNIRPLKARLPRASPTQPGAAAARF